MGKFERKATHSFVLCRRSPPGWHAAQGCSECCGPRCAAFMPHHNNRNRGTLCAFSVLLFFAASHFLLQQELVPSNPTPCMGVWAGEDGVGLCLGWENLNLFPYAIPRVCVCVCSVRCVAFRSLKMVSPYSDVSRRPALPPVHVYAFGASFSISFVPKDIRHPHAPYI